LNSAPRLSKLLTDRFACGESRCRRCEDLRFARPQANSMLRVRRHIEAVHTGQFVTGIIRDISKSGARCMFQRTEAAETAFKMDQQITLRCTFPGIPGEQSTVGTITEILKSEAELSIGIQFAQSVGGCRPITDLPLRRHHDPLVGAALRPSSVQLSGIEEPSPCLVGISFFPLARLTPDRPRRPSVRCPDHPKYPECPRCPRSDE
jgi:hypothetical protein